MHITWFKLKESESTEALQNLKLASTNLFFFLSHLPCVNCDDATANLLLASSSGARSKAGEDILLAAVEASVGRWGGRGTSTAIKTLLPDVNGEGRVSGLVPAAVRWHCYQ